MPSQPIDMQLPPLHEGLRGLDEGRVRPWEGPPEPREPRQLGTELHVNEGRPKIKVDASSPPLRAPHVSLDMAPTPLRERPRPKVTKLTNRREPKVNTDMQRT